MTDRDALYRAIIAHPDDDTPRLVYADWLQENDRPEEAEFVRVGCRLESETPDHPDYPELLLRNDELARWLGTHAPGPHPEFHPRLTVHGGRHWWEWSRRGFPRYIDFQPLDRTDTRLVRAVAAALEKAFAALPTRWLVVRNVTTAQLAELLKQPVVERLDALTVQLPLGNEPHDESARLLADCPRLRNLRVLSLALDVGEIGADALARAEHLGRLERLSIPGRELTPAAIRSLASAAWFRGLRDLHIDRGLSQAAFDELCGSGPFPRMHSLDLSGCGYLLRDEFVRSKAFPALARLVLRNNPLWHGRAAAVFAAKWLRPAYLDLTGCTIQNSGAEALARAPWLAGVRWLNLRGNLLSAKGVAAVAGGKQLAGLRYLDLGHNTMGAGGLRAVGRNPALRGLFGLRLGGNRFTNAGLAPAHFHEFLTRLDAPNLRRLSLAGRPVGARAARLLAGPKFSSLTRLDLEWCRLNDKAAAALLAAPSLRNLIELNLGHNNLEAAPESLFDRRWLPRLAWCNLQGNRVADGIAARLARRPGIVV